MHNNTNRGVAGGLGALLLLGAPTSTPVMSAAPTGTRSHLVWDSMQDL